MAGSVMIMAGGTGGHVFPALAVAQQLRKRGWDVFWLGVPESFEARVIRPMGIEIEWITISGIRGKGLRARLLAPLRLMRAMLQAERIIRRRRPRVALGMGGFVSGPGGLVARLRHVPLVIHEQNTIPGMTNRWLSRLASRVFEAFPGSFPAQAGAVVSGNPVRAELLELPLPSSRQRDNSPRLLVLGGSLGAQALNEIIPAALALLEPAIRPQILHQAGRGKCEATLRLYRELQINAEVVEFIDDMASAYAAADLVICRSGALTVSELAAVGVASILVPYPHAVDDHQTANARFLVDSDAALLLPQAELDAQRLAKLLQELLSAPQRLQAMADAAHRLGRGDSAVMIADAIEELAA